LNVVDACADRQRSVPPYGRTGREIDDEVLSFSRGIAREAGMPLLPLDSRGEIFISVGRAIHWLAMFTMSAAAVLYILPFGVSLTEAGAIMLCCIVLRSFGANLVTSGKHRLKVLAGKPSLEYLDSSWFWRGSSTRMVSHFLLIIGIAVVVSLNLLGLYFGLEGVHTRPNWEKWVGGASIVVLGLVIWLAHRAAKLQQPSADALYAADKRLPVLLLRSFNDEDLEVPSALANATAYGLIKDPARRKGHIRLEEAIADQLLTIGPLVAIGKPGERLPHLGAARNYYKDADWQEAARRWMSNARIIVVVAGLSGGLRWELDEIARLGYFRKLMVIIPRSQAELRWQVLRKELRSVIRADAIPTELPGNVRIVHIDAERQLVGVCCSGSADYDYERAIRYAMYSMFCDKDQLERRISRLMHASAPFQSPSHP
jgi:hypothetical protein